MIGLNMRYAIKKILAAKFSKMFEKVLNIFENDINVSLKVKSFTLVLYLPELNNLPKDIVCNFANISSTLLFLDTYFEIRTVFN